MAYKELKVNQQHHCYIPFVFILRNTIKASGSLVELRNPFIYASYSYTYSLKHTSLALDSASKCDGLHRRACSRAGHYISHGIKPHELPQMLSRPTPRQAPFLTHPENSSTAERSTRSRSCGAASTAITITPLPHYTDCTSILCSIRTSRCVMSLRRFGSSATGRSAISQIQRTRI